MTDTPVNETSDIAETLQLDGQSGRKKRRRRWLILTAILLVLIALFFGWNRRRNGGDVRYVTQPAVAGDLTVTVTATGNLEPINQVDVGSELSGIVRTVEVDYNDPVTQGQVLARLDTSKLEAQVLQSRAALDSAQAKVAQVKATIREARAKLNRLKKLGKLSDSRAVSPNDLEVAEATLARAVADEASANAEVDRAKAVLTANETDLEKAVIRSPINGVVLTRSVEPGQTVAASLQAPVLFTLAEDLAQMALHVDVDEADVGKVAVDQTATFTVDAYPERSFPARVAQVRFGPQTVEGVVTYETLLNVNNEDLSLRPGMTATADIVVQKIDNALLALNAALRFAPATTLAGPQRRSGGILTKLFPRPRRRSERQRGGDEEGRRQRVWILKDGAPAPIPVAVGATDGVRTQITGGDLKPDTELIVDAVGTDR